MAPECGEDSTTAVATDTPASAGRVMRIGGSSGNSGSGRWTRACKVAEVIGIRVSGQSGERDWGGLWRSEEHTSELPSLMRSSYSVFCLKKKTHTPPSHR